MSKTHVTLSMLAVALVAGASVGLYGVTKAQGPAEPVATTGTGAAHSMMGMHRGAPGQMGHLGAGQAGQVTAINGSTITLQSAAGVAGSSGSLYTIDASGATVMKAPEAGTLADVKVGDKVFVAGTTSGTNVKATKILLGEFPKIK